MIQSERRRLIAEQVQQAGSVTVSDLCELFEVSEMTIRRDLQDMDRGGLLRRVHGGAVSNLGRSYEPPLQIRSTTQSGAKKAIGRKASELIVNGDSIALDIGTTTREIVPFLHEKRNLTIITASIPIINDIIADLSLTSDVRLIVTGGIIRPGELSMTGQIATNTYESFHVDKAFIGIGGISIVDGLTEYNVEDALVKQPLIQNAHLRVVVADSSKLGRTTFASVAPISSVDVIITDSEAPKKIISELEAKGIEVIIADCAT